jgi:hypothetical protein
MQVRGNQASRLEEPYQRIPTALRAYAALAASTALGEVRSCGQRPTRWQSVERFESPITKLQVSWAKPCDSDLSVLLPGLRTATIPLRGQRQIAPRANLRGRQPA